MPSKKPISLDGSTLEGGGQLVRVAFSLSAITGVPVHVFNIRANRAAQGMKGRMSRGGGGGGRSQRAERSKGKGGGDDKAAESGSTGGGAKESHLAAVLWLAGRCGATVDGGYAGSREILFVPGSVGSVGQGSRRQGKEKDENGLVDLHSNTISLERPGSTCLILQCILPYLLFTSSKLPPSTTTQPTLQPSHLNPSPPPTLQPANPDQPTLELPTPQLTELTLHGGTNVDKAMTTDYLQHIFLPTLQQILGPALPTVTLDVLRRGWAGSAPQIGQVKVHVSRTGPTRIENVNAVDRGHIEKIGAVIIADGSVGREGILEGLKREIETVFGGEMAVEVISSEDSGDVRRLYVLLVAYTSTGYRLGRDYLGTGRRPKNTAEQKKITEECVRGVVRSLSIEVRRGGCVDEFMQDQIVVFQALARGMGRVDGGGWREGAGKGVDVEVGDDGGSLHARTVRWVCEKVLKRVGGVEFGEGGRCRGVGWNWEKTHAGVNADEDGVDLEEHNDVRSVRNDVERLSVGGG